MKTDALVRRSDCAIANALDAVGDRWSLLVVRDLLAGKRTYGELIDSPEAIPTNILADRLRRLEATGIVASAEYQQRPVRYAYSLTAKGMALGEVLLALVRWGRRYIPGTRVLAGLPAAAVARRVSPPAAARARKATRR